MQERDLSGEDVVALFLDGKSFADAMMVIALGITLSGKKRFLGFVETAKREGVDAVPAFTARAGTRQLPGSTVITLAARVSAVKKAFSDTRCRGTRENVLSRASRSRCATVAGLQQAVGAADQLTMNWRSSAAGSSEEGIEETASSRVSWGARPFEATNCLESINSRVERCAKVDHWKANAVAGDSPRWTNPA